MFDAIDATQCVLLKLPDDIFMHLSIGHGALGLKQDFGISSNQLSPQILVQSSCIAHESPVLLGLFVADTQCLAKDLEVLGILRGMGSFVLDRKSVV